MGAKRRDEITKLMDALHGDPAVRCRYEIDPGSVLGEFDLTKDERDLIASGKAEDWYAVSGDLLRSGREQMVQQQNANANVGGSNQQRVWSIDTNPRI